MFKKHKAKKSKLSLTKLNSKKDKNLKKDKKKIFSTCLLT